MANETEYGERLTLLVTSLPSWWYPRLNLLTPSGPENNA